MTLPGDLSDPEQEFFADGMAEDIIAALSRYRWFFVIAPSLLPCPREKLGQIHIMSR